MVSKFGAAHNSPPWEQPDHPAKYSPAVIMAMLEALELYVPPNLEVLDPFAGVGRIHNLRAYGYETLGVELEPEWAAGSPHTMVGDATKLPEEWRGRFGVVATSPPYGNRMADKYAGDAKGSRRHTYRISLGRDLTDGSAAVMQWGDEYRATMLRALREIRRVLAPNGIFLLNISDPVRKGALQGVPAWFEKTATGLGGLSLLERHAVHTRRQRDGANAEARADNEWLYVFHRDDMGSA